MVRVGVQRVSEVLAWPGLSGQGNGHDLFRRGAGVRRCRIRNDLRQVGTGDTQSASPMRPRLTSRSPPGD